MSTTNISQETEPLIHTVKLYNSNKVVSINLRPGKDLFALKRILLETTTWFADDVSPSQIVLYEEGQQGKTDSPTSLQKNTIFIVRHVPNTSLSLQVSENRGYVSNPWIRPIVRPSSFQFIGSQVQHVFIVDTSVVKAVMLGEQNIELPLQTQFCWISTKRVMEECGNDQRIQPLANFWPSYVRDCSFLIKGFTQIRQNLMFYHLYKGALQDALNLPDYEEFENSNKYANTCNDLVIYLEALIICRYIRTQRPNIKISFVTFDVAQGEMAELCKSSASALEALRLLVTDDDVTALNVYSLPSRNLSALF